MVGAKQLRSAKICVAILALSSIQAHVTTTELLDSHVTRTAHCPISQTVLSAFN